ncbi:MAG: hypothetical protein M3P29_07305 [Acidobacteriota bacterium]|nr:hypothetical protein [Acidobacteriota bacterium]
MNRKIATLAVVVVLVAGCSRSGKMQRGQEQYQVVQEGSASGVTSTINGPGETPVPATDTNVDTTTNFTLPTNPNPLGNDTAGSTVAGSLPSNPIYPAAHARTETRGMASSSAPVVTDTIGSTTPAMPKETHSAPPPETDTSTGTATTDTAATTPSDTKTKKDDGSKAGDQPPPPPPHSR